MEEDLKYFTMSVDSDLLRAFDLVAKKHNRNRTYHLRQLMEDAVADWVRRKDFHVVDINKSE